MSQDICLNFHGGNPESNAANALVEKIEKCKDQWRILGYLEYVGDQGATCDELETALTMRHQTCSARCSELLKEGFVIRKPSSLNPAKYERRATRTGSGAAVLVLASRQRRLF